MPELDSFDELRHANPRGAAGFEAKAAAMAQRTRGDIAAAAGAPAAAPAAPLAGSRGLPGTAVRPRLVILLAVGALVLTLLVAGAGQMSRSRAPVAPIDSSALAPKGTHGGASPGSATTSFEPATTVAASTVPPTTVPPTTVPPTTVPGATGPGATGPGATGAATAARPGGSATATTTRTGTRPVTTTAPTTVRPTPATVLSSPTCIVSAFTVGPPSHQAVSVQDSGSGLAGISNVVVTNGSVAVSPFSVGTKAAVVVTASKSDPALPTRWSFDATDVAGRTTHCS